MRFSTSSALGLLMLTSAAVNAQGGTIQGRVLDPTRDIGVENARITAWPAGTATLTDAEGRFRLEVAPETLDSLVVQRAGYSPKALVRGSDDFHEPLTVRLQPAPFQLDPLLVGVSFEDRLRATEEHLSGRMHRLPGTLRVASGEALQRHEQTHDSDPWRVLKEELGIWWAGGERTVQIGARRVRLHYYFVDEKVVWPWQFREVRPASLCRVEVYVPPRRTFRIDDQKPQLRAYTCGFMARVAEGEITLSRYLQEPLHAGGGEG